jgi:hypothetical protein
MSCQNGRSNVKVITMSTVLESPDPAARTLAAENEARQQGELLGET